MYLFLSKVETQLVVRCSTYFTISGVSEILPAGQADIGFTVDPHEGVAVSFCVANRPFCFRR